MTKGELAESLYHGQEGYNCAQAILKTFQVEFNIPEQKILSAKKLGRGNAEGGICGALYAALAITSCVKTKTYLQSVFKNKAGNTQCTAIRTNKKLNCKGCVKLVAETLETIF